MKLDMSATNGGELDALIARVALKDRQAFDILYAKTSARLFAVAVRVMKNRTEAEDVLQETYIRVWQRAQSFRPGTSSAIAWLITVTRNLAIDRLRSKKAPSVPIEMAEAMPDDMPTPEDFASAAQERSQIENCLGELDQKKAEAVRSAYVEGYSYQDLATRFGTPINTIRTWLRRSLIHLRACMERSSHG